MKGNSGIFHFESPPLRLPVLSLPVTLPSVAAIMKVINAGAVSAAAGSLHRCVHTQPGKDSCSTMQMFCHVPTRSKTPHWRVCTKSHARTHTPWLTRTQANTHTHSHSFRLRLNWCYSRLTDFRSGSLHTYSVGIAWMLRGSRGIG